MRSPLRYSLVKENEWRCHLCESWEDCLSQQKDSSYHLKWRKNHRLRKHLIFWVKKEKQMWRSNIQRKRQGFYSGKSENIQCSGFSRWKLMDLAREEAVKKATAKAFQLCGANVFHIIFLFQLMDFLENPSNNDISRDGSLIM